MRRFLVVAAIGALFGATPAWGAEVTLRAERGLVGWNGVARFHGTVATAEPQEVVLVRDGEVVGSTIASGGAFAFEVRARRPGRFVARTLTAASPPVALRVKPRLRVHLVGRRTIGSRVFVVGRLLPARAGRLELRIRDRAVRARSAADGRFRIRVSTTLGPRIRGRISLRTRRGYATVARSIRFRLAQPQLRLGAYGPAVLALKQRLWTLRYALPGVDAGFGHATYEAVLAFQKVHGLPRTGSVGPRFWRTLWGASDPRPRVRRGDYLEVDKGRQVLFEVRDGRVVSAIHVSTGATGNTPLGTWRVYSEVAGWSWVLWQPMYFLRGFAIHGYPEVPPWPASHGCVRVPMWLATGLRERWGYGSVVRVYP